MDPSSIRSPFPAASSSAPSAPSLLRPRSTSALLVDAMDVVHSAAAASAVAAAGQVVMSGDSAWAPQSAFPAVAPAVSSDSLLLSLGPLGDDESGGGSLSEVAAAAFSSPSKPVFVRSNPVLSVSSQHQVKASRHLQQQANLLPLAITDESPSSSSIKALTPLALSTQPLDISSPTVGLGPSSSSSGFGLDSSGLTQPRLMGCNPPQESKFPWIKTGKMDLMAPSSSGLMSPAGQSTSWTTLAADIQSPLGAQEVVDEPIDVTVGAAAAAAANILASPTRFTSAPAGPSKMKPPILLAEDLEQAGVRFVSAATASVLGAPVTVSPSTPRILTEPLLTSSLATAAPDMVCLTGGDADMVAAATPAPPPSLAPIRIAPPETVGHVVPASAVVPPISIVTSHHHATSTTAQSIRLVPSSSYTRPTPPSVPNRVRIIPEAKQTQMQTRAPASHDVKVVSVLNLSSTPQPVVSPAPAPLPTVILKPFVQEQPAATPQRRHTVQPQPSAISTSTRTSSRRATRAEPTTSAQTSQGGPRSSSVQPVSSDPRVESISCFKCTVCGFLGMTVKSVEEHCLLEHEEGLETETRPRSRRQQQQNQRAGSSSWMSVALQEGVKLKCPLCPNQFSAESSRSFKVHVTDDHDKAESEAEALFQQCNERRRTAAIEALRARKRKERERARKACPEQLSLEAYVDDRGELRVRTSGEEAETEASGDLSAAECIAAMNALKGDQGAEGGSGLLDKLKGQKKTEESASLAKRSRIGRPRGSRTVGITRLRRAASAALLRGAVVLSDARMGAECGVGDCAVRMRVAENLDRHRRSHVDPQNPVGFRCTECREDEGEEEGRFQFWSQLAMHLWRKHKIDMELYSCPECGDKESGFRCFTQARLQNHLLSHRKDRPCLCQQCGKGFKTQKSLKVHQKTHLPAASSSSNPSEGEAKCDTCGRSFKGRRRLLQHLASVHNKLRPHLCNFCGYAASNRSTLKLHLRSMHTGEKPYSCDECEYRSADHNSLRRHKMRHSGEKPYKCPHCSYASIQCSTFKVHLRSKHPDKAAETVFQCPKCVFKTVKKGNYLAHVASHKDRESPSTSKAKKTSSDNGDKTSSSSKKELPK